MERGPDIEIFVLDYDEDVVRSWIGTRLGAITASTTTSGLTILDTPRGPVTVTHGIEGGPFTSLWFNIVNPPWRSDAECALEAFDRLKCIVRYAAPDPCVVHEISANGEKLISWS